ncbi:MAG: hypothetical protein SOZ89_01130 [Peptoniphilaceae bacterium]|nr:hypothetical protein [Peptoniphilaceae bacterium]MDD7382955.1 hypothetical protein [Peptoniphilaceae bacterium]MDY3737706.1 hypothetical protein [Peptoniphilaceae bacterium]
MIKFVVGPSGSGKTKWLIEQANEEKKKGNENIVFIDSDDEHIFTLDYGVRLVNASEYFINSSEKLLGFIAGILARDYDIGKIYIDGIYDIVEISKNNIDELTSDLERLSQKYDADIYFGLNLQKTDLPDDFEERVTELKIEG